MKKMEKTEFACWSSFQNFVRQVKYERRYILTAEVKEFLDTVIATAREREIAISKDHKLFRAQLGCEWKPTFDEQGQEFDAVPFGYKQDRMKPRVGQATEGRANPMGLPVLYLATTEETALSEVRPWIGAEASIAMFKITRDLKAVNLSIACGNSPVNHLTLAAFWNLKDASPYAKQKSVWTEIDNAFSEPVTRSDDTGDYVPTQILAELFKSAGYDAIIYKSQFGKIGYNIALFDVKDAEFVSSKPYKVKRICIDFSEMGGQEVPLNKI